MGRAGRPRAAREQHGNRGESLIEEHAHGFPPVLATAHDVDGFTAGEIYALGPYVLYFPDCAQRFKS